MVTYGWAGLDGLKGDEVVDGDKADTRLSRATKATLHLAEAAASIAIHRVVIIADLSISDYAISAN